MPHLFSGHGGANQSDHLVARTERPDLEFSVANGRPAHGCARRNNACPVCSQAARRPVYCNQLRGMGTVERARRIIRELTSLPMPGDNSSTAADPGDAGREW